MVLRGYGSAAELQERIRSGPYPIKLEFENLAAGGDAISDLGTPMVTASDALDLAQSTAKSPTTLGNDPEYSITTKFKPVTCNIQSRRGDVLEIVYEAHVARPTGPVYDSSLARGTGQPYQMVLGSGDMIPGVDQGLYDMCPGEQRLLQIPPVLAYGSRGNKLYRIAPDQTLFWDVELVSVNSEKQGDTRTREEIEERE